MQCPSNSFRYNGTLCACNPGYVFDAARRSCSLFADWGPIEVESGVDYNSVSLPGSSTIFDFDSMKKLTHSQSVILQATFILVLSWLVLCFLARFAPLGDGRSLWFQIRWWISRLDICFATRHWLPFVPLLEPPPLLTQGLYDSLSSFPTSILEGLIAKEVFSHTTGVGFSIGICMHVRLLYQLISKRTIEVNNVRATNAPDLEAFRNDLEFNITTISSMTCSHLRGLETVASGNPGFVDYRVAPLSTFASHSCINTTKGPTIILKCTNCPLTRDSAFVSWRFIDLPNNPATAVGFEFNLTAKNPANKKHLSFVSGTLRNGSNAGNKPVTYRGTTPNILKFNVFPRIYRNMDNLRLIQPLFHEFLPGSSFNEVNQLQSSLQNSNDGLVNTTLYVSFLSSYIVEIDNENIMGPVSFLADLGGLYCISIVIFFYMMMQCENRIKRFRNEDSVIRMVRSRRRAQDHWNKLRKYVMYTWAPSALEDKFNNVRDDGCCTGAALESLHKKGSLHKQKEQMRLDTISFSRKVSLPDNKNTIIEQTGLQKVAHPVSILEKRSSSKAELENIVSEIKDGKHDDNTGLHFAVGGLDLPPPPPLEHQGPEQMSMSNLQRNIENLYEYNAMLREKLIAAQSMLHALANNESPSADSSSGSSTAK
nr:Phosvitin like [Ipomoea batatas]